MRILAEEMTQKERIFPLSSGRDEKGTLENMHNTMNNSEILNNSVLRVDLGALAGNVERLLDTLGEDTVLIPVLKNNAYGLGLEQVARVLARFSRITLVAVAQVSEGAALRGSGWDREILLLGGVPPHLLAKAVELDLTLSVGRLGLIPALGALAQAQGRRVKIQIKVETGLHRTGVAPGEELAQLLEEWRAWKDQVEITGAFSHFADLENQTRTQGQYQAFLEGCAQLEQGGMVLPLKHMSASAASEYAPQYQLGGVRLGRRLYMDHPTKPLGDIQEVATWQCWITNLRQLRKGDDVGYGGHVKLERDALVATICVGYGDGLDPQLVGVHGPVLAGGKRCPLLACCMDQTLVDVTGTDCQVGDPVTLFGWDEAGNFLPSQEVALLIGEDEGCGLTSRLSTRVARVYTQA